MSGPERGNDERERGGDEEEQGNEERKGQRVKGKRIKVEERKGRRPQAWINVWIQVPVQFPVTVTGFDPRRRLLFRQLTQLT